MVKYRIITCLLITLFITIFCLNNYAQSIQKVGKVSESHLSELSGIIPCSFEKGYFWVHNDSGDDSNIYLIDSLASFKLKVHIKGVDFIDVEDIGRFNHNGRNYLLIADIGNNLRNREVLSLYIIQEPKIDLNSSCDHFTSEVVQTISIKYKDKPRDAEAIFVDPVNNDVYLISKRDIQSKVFKFLLKFDNNTIQELTPILTLPFTFATSADISLDGKYILIKNLTNIYFWERNPKKSIIETLNKVPTILPYCIEPQGEAICFDLNAKYFYTISERPLGLDAYLYKYQF